MKAILALEDGRYFEGRSFGATGTRVGSLRVFGGVGLDLSALPSRFPYVLITPQYPAFMVSTIRR